MSLIDKNRGVRPAEMTLSGPTAWHVFTTASAVDFHPNKLAVGRYVVLFIKV